MKKIHTYQVKFYTSGNFLKSVWVDASNVHEVVQKVRNQYVVIEVYSVRFVR